MFEVNVRGTWLCCKAIAPIMVKAGKGKIINIASDIFKGNGGVRLLPYSCSKSAVYTLTQGLARALGPSGINVNSIGPGYTATEASLGPDGNTARLWVFLLAGAHLCGVEIMVAAKVLGVAFGAACLLLAWALVRNLHPLCWLALRVE